MCNDSLRLLDNTAVEVIRGSSPIRDRAALSGKFDLEVWRKGQLILNLNDQPNGIVDVGLNHLLETEFHAGTQVTDWYIGLINNSGFSALANGDTMSSHAGWAETSGYDEATRPQWTAGTASSRSITNASTVDFSINTTVTVKGIFITSNDTKGGTTGTLWSTAAFGSTVALQNGDTLKVTYTLSG